jgi:hypothetical protein
MTETPMALEINCTTGEETMRPLSSEEIAQREADALAAAAQQEEAAQAATVLAALKASAKAKLISGQPLTAEEADTLVI